jgi:hypothetical protein
LEKTELEKQNRKRKIGKIIFPEQKGLGIKRKIPGKENGAEKSKRKKRKERTQKENGE